MKIFTVFFLCLAGTVILAACPLNCDSCSSANQCIQCTPGYQLLQDYSCGQMNSLQGCSIYTLLGRCSQCLDGYNLFSGFCYTPLAHCDQYGPGNVCVQCQLNYTWHNGRCQLSNNTLCTGPTYALYQGMCLKVPISNCHDTSNGICSSCKIGYNLINGLCLRIGDVNQSACLQSNPDGTCNQCASVYYLQNSKCINVTPDNCTQNFGIYCLQCQKDYILNEGACLRPPKADDPNCNVVDMMSGQCIGCNFQYTLNSSKQCVRQNSYCQTSDSTGQCTSCPNQLVLINGICVYGDQNCILGDQQNLVCLKCRQGYALNQNQTSCLLVESCLVRDGSGGCTSCVDTYQLIGIVCYALGINCQTLDTTTKQCNLCVNNSTLLGGKCVYATNNCTNYDVISGICTDCELGYYLKDVTCAFLPSGCALVDGSYNCIGCISGFVLVSNICAKQVDNCMFYNTSGCQFCNTGFNLYLGRCAAIPQYCLIVDQQSLCLLCQSGTTLYQGKCVYYQVFCLDYNGQGNCSVAPRDFSINQNLIIVNKFANQWDNNGNFIICQSGYTLINNNCVLKIDNCTNYDQMGACLSCADMFYLNQTICINQTGICLVQQIKKCTQCAPQFAVVNGTCYGTKNFGVTFDSMGNSLNYQVGYALSTEYGVGIALNYNCARQNFSTGTCLQCDKFYTLEKNSCIVKDNNCLSYNARGICQVCSNGYKYIMGMCRSTQYCSSMASNGTCNACYSGFTLTSGICLRSSVDFCGIYDSDSVCKSCYPGYYLTPINTCSAQPKFCQQIDGNGGCLQCNDGYKLNGSQCLKLIQNCQEYSKLGCQTCQVGFALVSVDSCVQLPLLCKTINPASLKCSECLPGFVLVNNKEFCANSVVNCSSYNFDGSCRLCTQGFYLTNNRCINITNRCVTYDSNNTCIECAPTYTLVGVECRLLISNCNQYFNGLCSQCESSYYLNKQQQCQNNPLNCLDYSMDSNGCIACVSGFTVMNGGCVNNNVNMDGCSVQVSPVECKQCLPGFTLNLQSLCLATVCLSFDITQRCLECPPRFNLVGGQCTSKNCSTYNQISAVCIQCSPGYQLIQNNSWSYCRGKNCLAFDDNQQCTSCVKGYSLNNNQLCSIANCSNEVDFVCFACNDGFVVNNGFCQVGNCAQLAPTGLCLTCTLNYILVNGLCTGDPICIQLQPNGTCQQCKSGYSLAQNGSCQISNCQQLTPDGKCTRCQAGFNLSLQGQCMSIFCLVFDNNNSCTKCTTGYSNINQTCLISGCSSLNENGTCKQCNPRFDVYNGLCRPSNCTTLNDGVFTCKQCQSRYSVLNGQCLAKNCITYNNQKDCIFCANGYATQLGFCFPLGPNCASLSINGICITCVSGYQLTANANCIQTINNCQTYNFTGCNLCATTYTLTSIGICSKTIDNCQAISPQGLCTTCIVGYILQTNNNTIPPSNICVLVIDNCLVYGLQGCLTCKASYKVVNGACASIVAYCNQYDSNNICTICQLGYYLSFNICIPLPINCLSVNTNYLCTVCSNGNVLLRGACYKYNPLCLQYNQNNGDCLTCSDQGFIDSNANCVKLPVNCKEANPDTSKCRTCLDNFDVYNGICYKHIRNCTAYGQDSTCLQCAIGFLLSNGICLSTNCQVFDSGVCRNCSNGYTLTAYGDCQPLCTRTDSNSHCIQCSSGYTLIDGGACVVTIQQCNSYDTQGQCQICQNGYYIDAQRTCTILPPFCFASDPNSVCLQCNSGFILTNGFCVGGALPNNCASIDINGKCKVCQPQYTLLGSNCLKIPTGCASANTSGCISCRSGLLLINGICIPVILIQNVSGSVNISPNNNTSNSFLNLSLTSSNNISTNVVTIINNRNCADTDNFGGCLSCLPGFVLYGGQSCSAQVPNCTAYNSSNGICVTCSKGLIINHGICIIANCKEYSNSICSSCNTGFNLISNACLMPSFCTGLDILGNCISCATSYVLTPNACVKSIQFCNSYDSNQLCANCVMGYYLNMARDTCIIYPINCVQVNSTGDCLQCSTVSNNINGKCVLKINYCTQYSAIGECIGCSDGYFIYQSSCNQLPVNCLKVDSFLNCINCNQASILTNGICSTPIPNCFLYDSKGNCQSCKFLYYLNKQGMCLPYPTNCVSVDQLGNCLSCCFGSYLQKGTCMSFTASDSNCIKYDQSSNRCIQCSTDYMYCVSCNRCVQLDPNCYSFSIYDFTLCTSCNTGFYLISNICVRQAPGIQSQANRIVNCRPTYFLSGNHCFKNTTLTMPLSGRAQTNLVFSSIDPSLPAGIIPSINSQTYWRPATNQSTQYIGFRGPTVAMIQAVQLQGNGIDSWVTEFTLQFTNSNSQGSLFTCYNNCSVIKGNSDNTGVVTISFDYPIIATEIRLYPKSWQQSISCRLEFLID